MLHSVVTGSVLQWSVAAVSLIICVVTVICVLRLWWVCTFGGGVALKSVNAGSPPSLCYPTGKQDKRQEQRTRTAHTCLCRRHTQHQNIMLLIRWLLNSLSKWWEHILIYIILWKCTFNLFKFDIFQNFYFWNYWNYFHVLNIIFLDNMFSFK